MIESELESERARSHRFVVTVFGIIAALSLLASLSFHFGQDVFDLPAEEARSVTLGFLSLAIADTAVMFLWDRLFGGTRRSIL